MNCPACKSADVQRTRRHGMADQLRKWMNQWPYMCRDCGGKFSSSARHEPEKHVPQPRSYAKMPAAPEKEPVAQVVIKAKSHEHLDQILLKLDEAVRSFDGGSPSVFHEEPAKQRQSV